MTHDHSCPTCGSKLSAVQTIEQRPCNACRRPNPAGFLYCGYCASPMENTDIRARVAEVAAPSGGWPNLSAELLEVKFFLQSGRLDEAYEMLSILQRRYPGHPELADFARSTTKAAQSDPHAEEVVNEVLADSSTLAGQVLRRRAVKWGAPAAGGAPKKWTTAHEVVHAAIGDPDPEDIPEVEAVLEPEVRAPSRPMVIPKERTRVYRAVAPKPLPRPGHTTVVDALMPATPFEGEPPPAKAKPQSAKAKSKAKARSTAAKAKKAKIAAKTGRRQKVSDGKERKPRAVAFGAGVLSRFGR